MWPIEAYEQNLHSTLYYRSCASSASSAFRLRIGSNCCGYLDTVLSGLQGIRVRSCSGRSSPDSHEGKGRLQLSENYSHEQRDDNASVRRAEPRSAEPEVELDGAQSSRFAPPYSGALLGASVLNGRGNGSVKVAFMKQAQQAYGNRAVQRMLHGVPVQREGDFQLQMPQIGASRQRRGASLFGGEGPQLTLRQDILNMRTITGIQPTGQASPALLPGGAGSGRAAAPDAAEDSNETFVTWTQDFNLEAPEGGPPDRQPPGPSVVEQEQQTAERIQSLTVRGDEAEGTPLGSQLLNVGMPLLSAALAATPRGRELQTRLQSVGIDKIGLTVNPVDGNYGASVTFRIPGS